MHCRADMYSVHLPKGMWDIIMHDGWIAQHPIVSWITNTEVCSAYYFCISKYRRAYCSTVRVSAIGRISCVTWEGLKVGHDSRWTLAQVPSHTVGREAALVTKHASTASCAVWNRTSHTCDNCFATVVTSQCGCTRYN